MEHVKVSFFDLRDKKEKEEMCDVARPKAILPTHRGSTHYLYHFPSSKSHLEMPEIDFAPHQMPLQRQCSIYGEPWGHGFLLAGKEVSEGGCTTCPSAKCHNQNILPIPSYDAKIRSSYVILIFLE